LSQALANRPPQLTLGKLVEQLTEKWVGEPVSKLHVAIQYEDLLAASSDKPTDVPAELTGLLEVLRKELRLHEKKAAKALVE